MITGFGEAVAYVTRLVSGPLSYRTGKYWALSIAGYAITIISVHVLALTHSLLPAAALVVSERFSKAVRTPARDTMLVQASTSSGRGMAFALHEALDRSGALFGPLLVAAMLAGPGSPWRSRRQRFLVRSLSSPWHGYVSPFTGRSTIPADTRNAGGR